MVVSTVEGKKIWMGEKNGDALAVISARIRGKSFSVLAETRKEDRLNSILGIFVSGPHVLSRDEKRILPCKKEETIRFPVDRFYIYRPVSEGLAKEISSSLKARRVD
ncbi:Uncharacterised protein [uncultured archaeon]|nr:Uncharacterised protein [uncultured archaeon]